MDKTYAGSISNIDVLEFAIFCIENVSTVLSISSESLYNALTKNSDILYKYIVPNYEILHTQGKDYIVEDIIAVMKEEGVEV